MLISEWFDVNNKEHLKAYQHLMDVGCWPEGFIDKNKVEFESGWQFMLMGKMTKEYMRIQLKPEEKKHNCQTCMFSMVDDCDVHSNYFFDLKEGKIDYCYDWEPDSR